MACLALAGVLVASGGTLKVQVRSTVSQQVVNRKVTLTLTEAGPVTAGPWLIAGDWVSQFTDTNGLTYFSNVLAGQYRLDIAGTPSRSFPFGMPDTNGWIDAAALIGTTNSEPLFYTAAQIDGIIQGSLAAEGLVTTNDARNLTLGGSNYTQKLIVPGAQFNKNGDNKSFIDFIGIQGFDITSADAPGSGLDFIDEGNGKTNTILNGTYYGSGAGLSNLPPVTNATMYVTAGNTVQVKRADGTSLWKVDNDTGNVTFRGGLAQINGGDGSFFLAASAISGSAAGLVAPLFTGSGAGLTALSASQLTSGTVADAVLGVNLRGWDNVTTNAFAGAPASLGSIISNRNSAIINVKDFGALGNGADDSIALKQAFIAWTNRGGTLYFPQGTYIDTNTYVISVSGQAALDGSGTWAPFTIAGDGEGDSRWQAKITNATFIWSTNLPINFSNIRIEDWTVGAAGDRTKTNHGVRIYGSPQGNMVVSQTAFRNFLGYGLDCFSTDLGTLNQARFDGCGVGIRIGGFGDDWSGSVFFTKCVFAGMIYGFTNSASGGVRLTQGGNFYVGGNLNQNGIIVGPGNGFAIIGGAIESSSNSLVSVGFPPSTPAFVENAPQDASGSIGGIAIRNYNMLDNGTANGNNLVKIYTAPAFVQLENVNAGTSQGTAILSTLAGGDTVPVMARGLKSATNMMFSTGTFIKGWVYGGPLDWNAGSGYASYNGTNQTFGYDPVSGVTNMSITAPAVVGSRDFTNYVAWIANTFLMDSDASNYCARAGIADFATKFAINQFVLDIKATNSDGFCQITNMNGWWPMLGGSSNSTAQNLLGSTNNIAWAASGGTYTSDGVTGNGTTFYGDTALNLKTGAGLIYNTNSAFIYVYSRTQSPTDQGRLASGEQFNSFTVRNGIYPSGASIVADGPNNNNVSAVGTTASSDFRGSFAVTRTSSTSSAMYAGTNQGVFVDVSLATPNATFGFLARDTDQGQDHFSNAKIQGGGVGGALTYTHYIDLKTKWERCLALIALGQSIGATGPGSFLNPSNYFSGDVNIAGTRLLSVSHTNTGNFQTASANATGNILSGGNLRGSTFTVDNSGTVGGTLQINGLTASRLMLTDGTKNTASAAASGAVPVNADGTATTAIPSATTATTQTAGDNSTKLATTAYVDGGGGWVISKVAGSDATTTGQTLVDVTGLTFAAAASTRYEFEAVLECTTSAVTTGTEYGIQYSGTGSPTVQATITGSLTTTTAGQSIINALNTADATAFLTTSAQTGIIVIRGFVVSGSGAGNITVRHLKVTSGTSTVKIGSLLKVRPA